MAIPAELLQTKLSTTNTSPSRNKSGGVELIKSRHTGELIFAFCGPLGSGYKDVASIIGSTFQRLEYTCDNISISKIIENHAETKDFADNISKASYAERIHLLQNEGNRLRAKYGHDILSLHAIREIAFKRHEHNKKLNIAGNRPEHQQPRRHISLIESLKHPQEVDLLRMVYGEMFYLFGVLCPEDMRVGRLCRANKGLSRISKEEAHRLIQRDRSEDDKSGQQLIKTLHKSDFFIRNTDDAARETEKTIQRFSELILGDKHHTPTVAEYGMFSAYSTALRSGCISKQVGAAIISEQGDLLTTGRNDVPKFGGGLYTCDDPKDNRCLNISPGTCMTNEYKDSIVHDMTTILQQTTDTTLTHDQAYSLAKKIADKTRISNLIEFSRAIHAEMDAIVSAARRGISILGATLYCTAFPCHNCARHIVASGITEVYYIEPYEKSLAYELHNDSIILEPTDPNTIESKVKIVPFEGVAPRVFIELFRAEDRKIDGRMGKIDLLLAKPVIEKYMDSFIDYELKIVELFEKIAQQEKPQT